ncbi:PEP/pyruvate-binding domain-containing protein [Micromonospora sp. WMMD1082]|uniref:PEP/pyruvate-binding domain-containing protein n=1 Tax=Micromonospora sp. WMMD1082 TaxID=3016104 RepID=UPI002415D90A|nr:PEP/pyruvate-binding domain-containing protein [Micromonospora sp. WMMD1082]MDG4798307.1 PEP/pyruvate-binding domain-containing protein [Micromonospora sp. WMMD1082]
MRQRDTYRRESLVLIDLADAEPAMSGGKAAVLARLLGAGLPIPPGFVVPIAAYEQAVDGPSAELVNEIAQALPRIGGGYVAVRSSATSEDTAHATAAGQHDTFLGVRGPDQVADAVRRCWASLRSERAVAYWRRQGDPGSPTIAVLVQRLVDADVAGVMFTGDDVRLEASWGLGESVVSGHVTPDSWVVSGDAVTRRTLGTKTTRIDRTVAREVEPADRDRFCLTDDEVTRLARLGRQIADLLGGPQDIEWAIADSRVWILQARPVTSSLPAAPAAAAGDGTARAGTPASPGSATGPVRVVRGPADFARVRPGDVLVCRTTDPAWTPLFGVVAAVVTETGGLLSHAAIVARELGLPAVLAIPDATTALPDGAPVEVDGSTGRVALLDC